LHLRPFSATFVLRMRSNVYLWTSGVNLDNDLRFPDPDFLLECKISAIWRRFPLMFALYMLNSAIFLFPICLTYWPGKYTTRVDPHVDNSHEVWSWYDHTLRVIAFLSADTSRVLVTLIFDFLDLNSCHAWRVTWPNLPPILKTLWLSVHELRVITFLVDYH